MTVNSVKLTRNFTVKELRCRCRCSSLVLVPEAIEALQELRDGLGAPVHIQSAYRCPKHNKKVGGSMTSKHLEGRAFDISSPGKTTKQLLDVALQVPAFRRGGIGLYNGWIHVDTRTNGSARWGFQRGLPIPWHDALLAATRGEL